MGDGRQGGIESNRGLSIQGVTVERDGLRVFAPVSLRVAPGAALVVRGPNGAGKTTLIRAIAGLIGVASGRIVLDGVADEDQSVGERAHYVGHTNGIKPRMTVRENLEFWGRFLGGSITHVTDALDRFALSELADIPAGYLSAGQKRRAGLARLLVAHRRLWLLDEPTTSLDMASAQRVAQVVNDHLTAGGLAVVATHLPLGLAGAQTFEFPSRSTADDGSAVTRASRDGLVSAAAEPAGAAER